MYIALLKSMSSYAPRMGMPLSPSIDLSFAYKGEMTCSAVRCNNWLTMSLQHIGAALYIPTVEEIDAALAAVQYLDLLELFATKDAVVDSMCN